MILEIKNLDFALPINQLESDSINFPSIQTEINLHLDLPSSVSAFHLKSFWFQFEIIEAFQKSLEQLRGDVRNIHAKLIDISEELILDFSKSESAVNFYIEVHQKISSFKVSYSKKMEIDTINLVYRQVSEFIREVRGLAR